jgi:hypothetical protein
MSAETSHVTDISSGAATNEKKTAPKRPEVAVRKPVPRNGPEPSQEAAGWPNVDVVKFFDESRERMRQAFDQASGRFDHVRSAARESSEVLQDCHTAAISSIKEMNEQALDRVQTDVDRFFEYGRTLSGVKSLSDFIQAHGDFVRESMESQLEQARSMSEMSANLFKTAFEPLQTGMANMMSQAKKRSG